MANRDLRTKLQSADPFTPCENSDRLPQVMARWWEGWSLAQMAEYFGISRARVRILLLRVGCIQKLRSPDRPRRPDSGRAAPPARVTWAQSLLSEPLARRLTPRQLAAIAWSALGLNLVDAAKRMGVSPQRVAHLLAAVRFRVEKQAARTALAALPADAGNTDPQDQAALIDLRWDGLVEELSAPFVSDESL